MLITEGGELSLQDAHALRSESLHTLLNDAISCFSLEMILKIQMN